MSEPFLYKIKLNFDGAFMRIGIDARPLSKQRTGVGNYIEGLVEPLLRIAPEHEFFLYSNRELNGQHLSERVSKRIDRSFHRFPGALWLRARTGRLARRDRIEVFWSTYPILPAGLPVGVRKIVTIYDLVWMRFPGTTSRYNLFVEKTWTRKSISEADLIVVISRSTQRDLVHSLGVAIEKTRLIYPGVSEIYQPQDRTNAAHYISHKYGVPPRYMGFVGSLEPRKNLGVLVEALRILKDRNQLECPLLIAGAKGWKNSQLFAAIRAAGLGDEAIRFLGYLPENDLPYFYGGAEIFLFPTLYEGFGLPPLEAMACGTPVIASNAQCMPEVLGDAAILAPPRKAECFASAIVNVLGDEDRREAMRTAGILQAQRFRWDVSARLLLDVLGEFDPRN